MNLVNSLDSTLCVRLALVLCHFLWQGLVIAALAAACGWLLRRSSPQSRYWVYIGALALMAACLPATYLVVARASPEPPAVAIAPAAVVPQPLETVAGKPVALPSVTVVESPIPFATPPAAPLVAELPLPPTVETAGFPWEQAAKYATLAYLCGAALMLVRLLVGLRGGQRLRRDALPVEDPALLATLGQQARRLGMRMLPAIATCRRVATPVVVGILRPMILLPVSFATGLTAEQAAIVLTHELAHIRRYDHLVNLLQRAVEAILFFHPAVWYVSRRASVERENCCDDMVVAAGAEPFRYAESLLRIAELSFRQRPGVSRSTAGVLAASGRRPSQLRLRILRLLGGSQGPEVRLTRLGMAGIIATLLLLTAAPALMPILANPPTETTAPAEEKPANIESPYDHFLYVRHNEEKGSAKTDSLVLAKVTPDGFQQRDIFTKSNLHLGWHPLGVINGWAYGVKLGDLIAINLESDATEKLGSNVGTYAYDSGRLYTLMSIADRWQSTVLRVCDLRSRSYRDIGLDAKVNQHGIQRLAVSPDQQRLAFFNPLGNWMAPTAFRLAVVDLSNGQLKEHPTTVFARGFQTGGGDHGPGPTFTWLDAKTILMAHDVPKDPPKDPAAHVNFFGATGKVATMDIVTGQLTEVLVLPQWQRRLGEPRMQPLGEDRVPRIMLGELGQYRIDVKNRQLVEDNTLRGEYRYVRGREPEKLYYRDTLLAEGKPIPEVGVSPDGRRAVWLTARGSPSELRYYDAAEGKIRTIAKGWFPRLDVWGRWGSSESIILWATPENLAPAPVGEVPKGWQRLVVSPYPEPPKPPEPDPRPDVSSLLTMTLATDKPAYAHYEQVQLTVTLTNKTDKDVSFKRPEPFSDRFGLVGTGPRVSGVIDLFDRTGGILPTDPVVIKAGASLRITRPYEPIGIGEHIVTATPKLGDQQWQGRLKVDPIKFTVARSDREAELLKAKFDRFLKQCQGEFANDPATCNPYRFLDLEAEAVPLLAAAIESSDDPRLRQRLGYALARMATADALPYFQRLLAGEMKHDQEMVLEGLLTMVQRGRSADKALETLAKSLGHSSSAVRRGAAAHLRQIRDARVAAAFERAVEDSDAATAATAARYLAAYENIGLADWLAAAIAKPTHARYLAARSIVADLEKTWAINHGPLPAAPWKEASADPAAMEQYGKVLRAWEAWARQNPRSSEHFFDEDHNLWQWTRELQAEAAATPPRLSKKAQALYDIVAANVDQTDFCLGYEGPRGVDAGQGAKHSLLLHTTGRQGPPASYVQARISTEQARRILDHLAATGYLDGATDYTRMSLEPVPKNRPGYLLSVFVREGKLSLLEDLRQGADVAKVVQGLRGVLTAEAAAAADKILGELGAPAAPAASAAMPPGAWGEAPWGQAVNGVQVRLRAESTKWSMRETPEFRADVRAQGDHDLLLATVEGLGCELHFDGVKYHHPTNLTGVAYHNIKAWEHGFTFSLDKEWTTIEGNRPLTLTSGKHTVRFAWAGYHLATVNGGMVPDETRPVLLLSNPVEIEILAADAKPAIQPDTNPGNRTVIDVHGGSVRIKSGDNTLEAERFVLESAAPPADKTSLDKEIEKESMEQVVCNLAHSTLAVAVSPSISVDPLVHSVNQNPRVAKLLKIARDGTADERGALRTAILRECANYLKDLPDFAEEGKPWKPSAVSPGGAMAYPLILRQCDSDAESLPVLVQMWLRHQDALRKHSERQGFKRPSAEWSSSDDGALQAYACKYFLDQYVAREDLRRNIKPAQAKVLDAYKAYRDSALQTDKVQSDQTRIMRFAVDFVEAGADKIGHDSRREESGGARVTLLLDHNRTEYLLGENITVCYRLENVGNESIRYEPGAFFPALRLNDAYRVTAVPVDNGGKPIGQPLESWPGSTDAEGPMVLWEFEPGKVSQQTLYLPRYVRFDKPGRYLIRIVNHPRGDLKSEFSAGETTITLKAPTPEQAREIYQAMKKLPRDPVAGIGERRDQVIADFEALIHPVYLPILLEYAQDGDADALDGLGNLHTMQAAEALISIVRRALEKDQVDLALAAYQHLGHPPEQPGTVGQTWRPEFAEPLRNLASRLAHDREPKALGDIAHIYMVLGTAKDLPDLTLAFSKAIEVTKTLPFETHQYFRPRGAVYSYRFAVPRLLERGARVSENPRTPGEAAAYLIALRQHKDFRPQDWPAQVVRWLGHETPYLREFVLEYMPEPVPEAALAMLPGLLADTSGGKPDNTSQYVDLQIAACHAAKKHPRDTFRQPLLNILKKGTEGHLLEAAAAAGRANGITTDQIMEVWLSRIDNSDLGGWAVAHLVLSILDDNWARQKNELEPNAITTTRQRWSRFIQEHREQLREGHRFKLGDPEITADLFPRGFQFHRDGKPWPPGNE